MEECFVCGISGSKVRLFDAITKEGIKKICESCSDDEHIPVIKKPTTFQLKESERKGLSFHQKANIFSERYKQEKIQREKQRNQDIGLRDIVDKNYKKSLPRENKPRPDLVDNFNWIIMRARKKKHMTTSQLAEAIVESEAAVKMAEKGILPEDDYRLVNKLENYLRIRLKKQSFINTNEKTFEKSPARVLNFEEAKLQNLTIADLQKMKKSQKQIETCEIEENEQEFNIEEFEELD